MKRLILVRHAKTERSAESGEDFDRALTREGEAAAHALGSALAGAGLIPAVALVSTALRARQTFEAMAPALPDVRLAERSDLYNASAETLMAAAEAEDGDPVMLVAHNPGVGALAQEMAGRCTVMGVEAKAALETGYPTATASAFEFDGERLACLGVFRSGGGAA